ncbi:hypothetical protein RHMOL_Rhmol01G0064000 [Rhododendron molle]|uniref:Uncharacterized protein n=1 Tax=Rhododendron molle TaxID=49168 RepID=A0ACC0Q036_RHOML|nr:hypothetical protein RHMOL_Rhmol01G0064000 [Rhododendron molle]
MRSTSKICKRSKKLSLKKCEDRISNLPCNLMSHILSFLPTKSAVATCVLSTKWKQSWTSYDSVDFDDTVLQNPHKSDRTSSLQTSFTSFIDRVVLLHRVSRLNKFHLKCTQSYDLSHVNAWIAAALLSSVQELHLSIPMEHSTELPQDLFSCGTLVVLKLGAKFVMNVPASVHLPNLKILHLHSVEFSDDDSIDRLICGCPVLDELSMKGCVGIDVHVVKISAPMLTSLVMYYLYSNYWEIMNFPEHSYKIVLETPALLFLDITDMIAEGYSLQSLSYLAEARISIFQTNDQFESDYSEALNFPGHFIVVDQVKYSCLKVMQIANCQKPKFHCMTYLELGPTGGDTVVWQLLPELLENSPRLGSLVFGECIFLVKIVGEIMRSTSKIRKRSKQLSLKKCEDRISNLPCNLMSHILSFLPTKSAVATCVLSTKWKQSWTSYDSVDFDDTVLLNPHKSDRTSSLQTSFTSFIDRVVLLHRVSRLNKFHLKCTQSYDLSHVNAWIAAALLSSVQELHLSIPMEHSTELPQDLFSRGTLVVLKLGAKFVMNVPASVHLLNLKILHLHSVEFSDDDSIDRLICGCPVLDELSMKGCVGIDVHVVKISAPMLTSLVMYYLYSNYWEIMNFPEHSYKIVLETPALLFLDITDMVAEGYSLQNLCHLAEARISIFETSDQLDLELDFSEAISDFLKGLSNVQRLYLSSEFMEVDSGAPIGPELVHCWNPPQCVPSCLLFHLKEIKFRCLVGEKDELELLDYFLNNARVLEKVNLCHSDRHTDWKKTFYTMTRAEGFKKLWMT